MRQHEILIPACAFPAKLSVLILITTMFLALASMGSAQSGVWSPAVILSNGGDGWESSAAIDGAGNSVAIWDERTTKGLVTDRIWGRVRPDSGAWLPHTIISRLNPPLGTTYVFPVAHASASGKVTSILSDVDGVSTADAVRGKWTPAQLLLPGVSSPKFMMNARGDAILVWGIGGPRFSPNYVYAMRRPAGGAWGQQETVVTAPHVSYNDVVLGENGDAFVTWETYDATYGIEQCQTFNYAMHVSRTVANGGSWDDSGALLGPDAKSHQPHIAADASGRADLLYMDVSGALFSMTQQGAGQPWSAPVQVYTSFSYWNGGIASDKNGIVTVVMLDQTLNKVISIRGSLKTNSWTKAVAISGNDQSPQQVIFGLGMNGAAVAVWLAGDPNYTTLTVRAAVAPASNKPWGQAATISPGLMQMPGPESVAVNATGKAVVTFSAFTVTLGHNEYAVNYTP